MILTATISATPPAKPALANLLERAADYNAAFTSRASGASLDEPSIFIQVTAGRMHTPMHFHSAQRQRTHDRIA